MMIGQIFPNSKTETLPRRFRPFFHLIPPEATPQFDLTQYVSVCQCRKSSLAVNWQRSVAALLR
jgi:hypothetical protein